MLAFPPGRRLPPVPWRNDVLVRTLWMELSAKERASLEHTCRQLTAPYREVRRAQLILALADGVSYKRVARVHRLSRNTVRKWARRFLHDRLDGMRDRPRSGRPPTFSPEARTHLVALACRAPADEGCSGTDRWTLDLLVDTALRQGLVPAIHRATVARLLVQGEIKPYRWQMWLHSHDPAFKQKINDIVALYLADLQQTVLCIDEKTGIQALERKYPDQPPTPSRPGRREFEYIRHGTLTLFAAREVHSGQVTGWCTPQRRRTEFLAFMDQLADRYPTGRVHCVLDNLNTHHGPTVSAWLERHERFVFHFTPFHASWINQIEVWFSILARRLLRGASFYSVEDLEARIGTFIDQYNARARPFTWTWKGYPLVA